MDLEPHEPRCPLWGQCGGCDPLVAQQSGASLFAIHVVQLQKMLQPFAALRIEPVASPKLYHQRRRVLLRMHCQAGHPSKVGFFAKGSRELLSIANCLQLRHELQSLLPILQQFRSPYRATLRIKADVYIHHRQPSLLIDIHIADIQDGSKDELTYLLQSHIRSSSPLGIAFSDECEEPLFCEEDGLFFSARGFRQSHAGMNQILRDKIAEYLRYLSPQSLIEMGCGNGNLTVAIKHDAPTTYVDHDRGNIVALQANISRFSRTNTAVIRQTFTAACAEMVASGQTFDIAIFDPPRAGLKNQASLMAAVTNTAAIYVSCNAKTMVEDLRSFTERGFKIRHVTALDMFPLTSHWETVVLLQKQKVTAPLQVR